MLNSGNENISEIICIKFSIDGQIVPGKLIFLSNLLLIKAFSIELRFHDFFS